MSRELGKLGVRKGARLLVALVGDLFLGKVFLDHGVPGLFQGFVHGEGL